MTVFITETSQSKAIIFILCSNDFNSYAQLVIIIMVSIHSQKIYEKP